jgi:hypothetical protein
MYYLKFLQSIACKDISQAFKELLASLALDKTTKFVIFFRLFLPLTSFQKKKGHVSMSLSFLAYTLPQVLAENLLSIN